MRHAAGAEQFDDPPRPKQRARWQNRAGAGLLDQLLQQTTLQGLASLETVPLVLAHGANGLAGDL